MSPRWKMNDCFYYYNGYCYKGDSCPFRHEPRAFASTVVCKLWRRRRCYNRRCPHRHAKCERVPRYWEDRTGRVPFLSTRHAALAPPSGERELWTRRVFLPFQSRASTERDDDSYSYSPIVSRLRERSSRLQDASLERQDIRVVLQREESPSAIEGLCSYSTSHTPNEDSYETPVEIKTEASQKRRPALQRSDIAISTSNEFGDSTIKCEMTAGSLKTEQDTASGWSPGCIGNSKQDSPFESSTAMGCVPASNNIKLSHFNINSQEECHDAIDKMLNENNACETHEQCKTEQKCKNTSNCLKIPKIKIKRIFCMERTSSWKVSNVRTPEDPEHTAPAAVEDLQRGAGQLSPLSPWAPCSRHDSSGISEAFCGVPPCPIGYYTRSRARAERMLGSILQNDQQK